MIRGKAVLGHHVKSDGKVQVKIYIYDPKTRKKELIPTDIYIKPKDFSEGKVKKTHRNADYLNNEIGTKIVELERTSLKNKKLTLKQLKKGNSELSLFAFINLLIQDMKDKKVLHKGQPFPYNTVKSYVTYTNYLKAFNPNLNWQDITGEFYDAYCVHLQKEYSPNTIAKAIKILKTIMRKGSQYHSNNEYVTFSASYQESDSIALTEEEIESIMSCTLPENLARERDRFFVSYNLFLRFGDSISLSEKDIFKRDGSTFVKVTHEKTKNVAMIPLFKKSIEILKKYKYTLPQTSNQVANRRIKEIAEKANIKSLVTVSTVVDGKVVSKQIEKYKLVTTHTARRSMATNYYLSMAKNGNLDLKRLQLLGGWKSMIVLERYLKIDKLQTAITASKDPFFN
jgi:site-specific recombinase XerD